MLFCFFYKIDILWDIPFFLQNWRAVSDSEGLLRQSRTNPAFKSVTLSSDEDGRRAEFTKWKVGTTPWFFARILCVPADMKKNEDKLRRKIHGLRTRVHKGVDTDGVISEHSLWTVSNSFLLQKNCHLNIKLKRKWKAKKAIPLQAWTGLEGSGRLRLPDF